MEKKSKQYEDNPDFLEFLNREFDKTVVDATIEEIAEFAFGSMEKAIESFNQQRKDES
jgi:hypothetical protein